MPAAIGYLPKVNLCTRWQHLKVPSILVKNNSFQVTYEEPGENQLHTPQILDTSLNSCILSTFLPLNDCRQNFQFRKMADHINIFIPTGGRGGGGRGARGRAAGGGGGGGGGVGS